MIRCYPRRPMRWNAAIGAIARCKATSIGCARKRRSVRVLRWICGVKPTPKAVNKPWQHFIVHGLDKPGVFTTVSGFETFSANGKSESCETAAFGIGKSDAFTPELGVKGAVLFQKIGDDLLL